MRWIDEVAAALHSEGTPHEVVHGADSRVSEIHYSDGKETAVVTCLDSRPHQISWRGVNCNADGEAWGNE
jgi:hypothetical protein